MCTAILLTTVFVIALVVATVGDLALDVATRCFFSCCSCGDGTSCGDAAAPAAAVRRRHFVSSTVCSLPLRAPAYTYRIMCLCIEKKNIYIYIRMSTPNRERVCVAYTQTDTYVHMYGYEHDAVATTTYLPDRPPA